MVTVGPMKMMSHFATAMLKSGCAAEITIWMMSWSAFLKVMSWFAIGNLLHGWCMSVEGSSIGNACFIHVPA